MNTRSVFKMGVLSVMAATGLCMASNSLAADTHTASTSEDMKSKAVSGDGEISDTPAPPRQVVDSNGNVYLLIPLQTKDGTACGEPVHEYIPRIGA